MQPEIQNPSEGTGNSFAVYSSAIHKLSELESQRTQQELHATTLDQLGTYLSILLPDPSNNSIQLVRAEAARARLTLNTTVN